jgi:ubiquinone biosynthesis protein COQ4
MDNAGSAISSTEADFPAGEAGFFDLPIRDPKRAEPRYRPLKAWRHFRRLVKDKENTYEVFHIFEALPWKGMFGAAQSFLTSERGKELRASEPDLWAILDDHEALRRMPEGSLAQAYCDFMESEGLTAKGLIDEYDRFMSEKPDFHDQFTWYFERIRDTHDLLHVLTGYGRDALGEQCVLAFTYGQQPAPAHLFIAYAGAIEIKRQMKSAAPVMHAIREGQRLGKACPRLCEQSMLELLALPLEEAREQLNIVRPKYYHEAHRIWRAMGVDPYDILKRKAGQQAFATA